MATNNARYNNLLATWNKQRPLNSPHLPECEQCGKDMTGRDVYAGDLGWFCSLNCLNESIVDTGPSDEDERRIEAQQMGFCG